MVHTEDSQFPKNDNICHLLPSTDCATEWQHPAVMAQGKEGAEGDGWAGISSWFYTQVKQPRYKFQVPKPGPEMQLRPYREKAGLLKSEPPQ